jgi:photosystem II stability/assembly factor-like uncharacterized protein
MSELEDRLRHALQHPASSGEAERVLAEVHRGARRRRQRGVAASAAVALVAVAVAAVVTLVGTGPDRTTDALPAPTPTSDASGGPVTAATNGVDAALTEGTTGVDGAGPGSMWRVDTERCSATLCARVYREGSSSGWAPVAELAFDDPAEAERLRLPPVESIRVRDDGRSAWAFGLELWSTHDGGGSWVRADLVGARAGQGVSVETAGDEVFALQSAPLRLWHSPAAADIWTPVDLPAGYASADQMVALGDRLVVRATRRDSDRRVLLLTDDGGTSWQQADAPCQGEVGPIRSTGTALMAPCPADQSTDPGADLAILSSTDGRTWQRELPAVSVTSYVDDVYPIDDHSAFVVAGEAGLIVTPGGQERVDLPIGRDQSAIAGGFVDPDYGYLLVAAPRRLLGTEDGGRTWSPVG